MRGIPSLRSRQLTATDDNNETKVLQARPKLNLTSSTLVHFLRSEAVKNVQNHFLTASNRKNETKVLQTWSKLNLNLWHFGSIPTIRGC